MSAAWQWIFSDAGIPVVFLVLMGISMLVYAILDGYDLGIGILMFNQQEAHRDRMIASIGPFWDANETWLVLGVGVLLVAFPLAHGQILGQLYLPVSLMLIGLILRGVSFDFRAKANVRHKTKWDSLFALGSLLATTTQGYMLGQYIVGFESGLLQVLFSLCSAACVTAAYVLIGASWLVLKTENELRTMAITSALKTIPFVAGGLLLVSVVNPLVSDRIFERWFIWPEVLWLVPLPCLTFALLLLQNRILKSLLKTRHHKKDVLPFLTVVGIFVLAFIGLAYSFYPFIIPGKLDVWQAASAPESLRVVLWGCIVVLPAIALYTILSYWIFRGKATALSYE